MAEELLDQVIQLLEEPLAGVELRRAWGPGWAGSWVGWNLPARPGSRRYGCAAAGRSPCPLGEKATYIFRMAGWADQRRRAYQSARGKWTSVFFPSAVIPYMPMSTT